MPAPPLSKYFALLGADRWAQSAVITASSSQPAYPASNLANLSLWGTVYRSAVGAVSGVSILIDLLAAKAVQGVELIGCNFADDAERSIAFSNAADLSSPVYTVTRAAAFDYSLPRKVDDTPPWGKTLRYLHGPGALSCRYVGITIWDPNNVWGFLRVAIALVESVWQPARNMEKSWGRGLGLQGDPGADFALRDLEIPLKALTPAEDSQLQSLMRYHRTTGRLSVVPVPLSPETWPQSAIWCTFGGMAKTQAIDAKGRFRTVSGLTFKEVNE